MDNEAPLDEPLAPKAAFAVAVLRIAQANPDRPRAALAELLGCSRANISQVLQREGLCPHMWVVRLSNATGIDRALLRPDLYAEPEA